MSDFRNIACFESRIEALEEDIDTFLKDPDTDYLIKNYSKDDIHIMRRLIKQRTDIKPTTLGHLDAIFHLAESIKRVI